MKRKISLGLLALIIGLVLCGVGAWLLLMPTQYEAVARIEIDPDVISDVDGSYVSYDPYFIETELKAMQGEIVLSNVVQDMNLNMEWGKRYGRTLDTSKTIELLRRRLSLDADRNTKIVEIHFREGNPDEAAQIANDIVAAYQNHRMDQDRREIEAGIKALEEQYQEEETNILITQSKVDQLRAQCNINDTDPSPAPVPIITIEQMQELNTKWTQELAAATELADQFAEFQAIQATNPIRLADSLLTINDDAKLANLLGKLHENEQKLITETNYPGTNNLDRVATLAVIDQLKKEISDRVSGIMIGLQVAVQAQKDEVATISNRIREIVTGAQDGSIQGQYWKAKRDLLDKRELLQMLAARLDSLKADAQIPVSSLVRAIAPAVPPKNPVGLNRWWGFGFLIGGLAISGIGLYSLRAKGNKI